MEYVEKNDKEFLDLIDLDILKRAFEPLKKKLSAELSKRYNLINQNEDALSVKSGDNQQLMNKLMEVISNQDQSESNFMLGIKGFEKYGARSVLKEILSKCDLEEVSANLRDKNNIKKGID